MSLPIVSEATTHLHDLSRLCKCISRLHPIFVECFCDSQRPSRSALKQGKSTFDMQISRQKMWKMRLVKDVIPDEHEDCMSFSIISEGLAYPNDLTKVCKFISRLPPIRDECFVTARGLPDAFSSKEESRLIVIQHPRKRFSKTYFSKMCSEKDMKNSFLLHLFVKLLRIHITQHFQCT